MDHRRVCAGACWSKWQAVCLTDSAVEREAGQLKVVADAAGRALNVVENNARSRRQGSKISKRKTSWTLVD